MLVAFLLALGMLWIFKAFYMLVVSGTVHVALGTGNDVSGTVPPPVGDRNQEPNTFATIY